LFVRNKGARSFGALNNVEKVPAPSHVKLHFGLKTHERVVTLGSDFQLGHILAELPYQVLIRVLHSFGLLRNAEEVITGVVNKGEC
jgi:hypothetical protein